VDDLSAAVIEALHLEFLLEGLDERELLVAAVGDMPQGAVQQISLRFEDPLVGVFEAILELPPGKGPWPALVVHPGRRETARVWLDENAGLHAAHGGVALLILEPRACGGDELESTVVRRLLNGGFSLIALRVYETLLLHKYLRWRGDIRAERIALVGSDSAAAVGNLVIRVEPRWAAYVGQGSSTYAPPPVGGNLGGETAPELTPLHPWIADIATASVPTYRHDPSVAGFYPAFEFLWPALGLTTAPPRHH
jgi:hypothetical protein